MLAAIKAAFGMKVWPEFTREEVAKHNTPESLWIVADDKVYDATSFVYAHPGGHMAILKRGGGCANCREDYKFHSKGARDTWKQLQIGVLSAEALSAPTPAYAAPDPAMLQRETPLLRYGSMVAKDAVPQSSFAGKQPLDSIEEPPLAATSFASPTLPKDNDLDDGGEDMMACGRCCRNDGPSAQCRNCPRAPRSSRHSDVRSTDPSEDVQPLRR